MSMVNYMIYQRNKSPTCASSGTRPKRRAPEACRSARGNMTYSFPWFVRPCLNAFRFLVERYGFQEPKVEQLGRECFIRYQKDNRIVSIAHEPGSAPIVELFYPTHDMKNRRIPSLESGGRTHKTFESSNEQHHVEWCQAQASDMEKKELPFLKGEENAEHAPPAGRGEAPRP